MNQRLCVLVVEDDAAVSAALAAGLRDAGYEVMAAGDGAEALHLVQRRPPDAVVLDLVLPRMNAWTFVDAYRRLPGQRAPIIAMTSFAARAQQAAQEIGATDVLVKPFALAALLDLIEHATHSGPA